MPRRCREPAAVTRRDGSRRVLEYRLVPYDLTRGGSIFSFHGRSGINQYAIYVTDTVKLGHFTINAGLRDDQYNGLASANGVQPRLGIAYLVPKSGSEREFDEMPNWRGVQNFGPATEAGCFDDRTGRRRTVRRGVGPVGLSG